MADPSDLASDLLRGGKQIALVLYGDDSPEAVRRLYHEQNLWPVFQLDDCGALYALKSRLLAFVANKSAEAEARIIAAAKLTSVPKPPKLRLPKHRRRRARSPASNAA